MNILYCGDKDNAPWYIEGTLVYLGHRVKHVAMEESFPSPDTFDAVILSDYPAKQISEEQGESLHDFIRKGKRLIMLGGWDSFNGFGINYHDHSLSHILPVKMKPSDDRVNSPQGLVLHHLQNGKATVIPDWKNPPIICGYNETSAKVGADVLVEMLPLNITGMKITTGSPLPLVVKGNYESGTVITCATDLAPHWCGGLIDWGGKRISLNSGVEVGEEYPKFMQFLLEV